MPELIDPSRLQTVPNYAAAQKGGKGVTASYIYRLIREDKFTGETKEIDGVVFVVLPEPPATPRSNQPLGEAEAAG